MKGHFWEWLKPSMDAQLLMYKTSPATGDSVQSHSQVTHWKPRSVESMLDSLRILSTLSREARFGARPRHKLPSEYFFSGFVPDAYWRKEELKTSRTPPPASTKEKLNENLRASYLWERGKRMAQGGGDVNGSETPRATNDGHGSHGCCCRPNDEGVVTVKHA